MLAVGALVVTATGPLSTGALELLRHWQSVPAFLQVCVFFGVLRVLGAPVLAAAMLLGACLTPTRFSRWALLGSTAVEGLVAVYAVIKWFILPRLW
jgi:hypothetical protein